MNAAAGTGRVIRGLVRTGRIPLLAWPATMAALVTGTGSGITVLYPTPADRATYAASMGLSSATKAFNGDWADLTTLGGITAYEVGFMGLLLLPPIGVHLALSRTRAEEDSGRAELVTAGRLARLAPLAGVTVTITAALLLFAVLATAGLVVVGLPSAGSAWYAGSLALMTWWFAALGLLLGQLVRDARTGYAWGIGAALGCFAVRAVIDGRELDLEWATPTGWLPLVRPFGPDPSVLPLLLFAGTGVALVLAAAAVAVRRDLGGGVLAPRPGPERGTASLGHPAGIAWRLTRGAFLGWTAGLIAWGAAIGSLAGEMTDLIRANPVIGDLLGIERPEDIMTSLAVVVLALGAVALGLQVIGTLAGEEHAGRLGLILGTRTSRARVWTTWWLLLTVEVAATLGAGALTLAVATRWSTGESASFGTPLTATATLAAAVGAIIAVAALAASAVRAGQTVGWVLLGWAAVVALLGEALRLPGWARHLSPLEAVGRVPVEDADAGAVTGFVVLLALGLVAATLVARHRDLRAG